MVGKRVTETLGVEEDLYDAPGWAEGVVVKKSLPRCLF